MSANETPKDEAVREPEGDKSPQPVGQVPGGGNKVPLFLRGSSDGYKGNEQDEKDEVGE
jgi:hypothetical protein